jgi:hypothetical protein
MYLTSLDGGSEFFRCHAVVYCSHLAGRCVVPLWPAWSVILKNIEYAVVETCVVNPDPLEGDKQDPDLYLHYLMRIRNTGGNTDPLQGKQIYIVCKS